MAKQQLNYTASQINEKLDAVDSKATIPTITLTIGQVVSQNPITFKLTDDQYNALSASKVAVVDATALSDGYYLTVTRGATVNSMIRFFCNTEATQALLKLDTSNKKLILDTQIKLTSLITEDASDNEYPTALAVKEYVDSKPSGGGAFIVDFVWGDTLTCNKTFAQIKAAVDAGNTVQGRLTGTQVNSWLMMTCSCNNSTSGDMGGFRFYTFNNSNIADGNGWLIFEVKNNGETDEVTYKYLPFNPNTKDDTMTQAVGIDDEGKLWAVGGGASSGIPTITLDRGNIILDGDKNPIGIQFTTEQLATINDNLYFVMDTDDTLGMGLLHCNKVYSDDEDIRVHTISEEGIYMLLRIAQDTRKAMFENMDRYPILMGGRNYSSSDVKESFRTSIDAEQKGFATMGGYKMVLPEPPASDGNYVLQLAISGGGMTYTLSWVQQ